MNIQELVAQKEAIEAQIAQAKAEASKGAVESIKALMKEYGVTLTMLKGATKKVAAKYAVGDKQWTGRGVKPQFIRDAEANGTLQTL